MNIKIRVKNLKEKYFTKDPFKLAKKLNISVRFCELGNIKGLYKKILKRKYIFINSELSDFEQKLVCAHELGHAILHSSKEFEFMIDRTRLIRRSIVEDEANLFASWLLFDDDELECVQHEYSKNINSWIIDDIINIRKK